MPYNIQLTIKVKNPMPTSLVISKMKVILIIDILIVAFAAGTYAYLQNQGVISTGPKPAAFQVNGLVVDPIAAETGEPISVSVNVTNIGDLEGNYTANLLINNLVNNNQTVDLPAGQTSTIEFSVTENIAGNYTAQIEDLSASFNVTEAPPVTSSIKLTTFTALPYEVWVGENVTITTNAQNPSGSEDSLTLKLSINNEVVETRKITLAAGASEKVVFNYTAPDVGKFKVTIGNTGSSFIVVPTGKHTLFIISNPKGGIDFELNGVKHQTPYQEIVDVGIPQTISMPAADPTGKYTFLKWEDGVTSSTRIVTLTARLTVTASFSGGTSCPSLYMWNGTGYQYVSDISNHGWLGYINYVNTDGSVVFYRNNPWDYIPLNSTHIKAINNVYNITLIQRWNEIFYLDQAYMMVVDHPADVNVYSTMVEQYLDPNYMGQIYTVSKNPLVPVSAVNEKGENVLPQISAIDNIFTKGINGIKSPAWNNINWNSMTMNLGNLKDAKQVKLIIRAVVDWGSSDDYSTWLNRFFDPNDPVPNGTQITPPPVMEVKAANGSWIPVPESREFPLPPDVEARTYVVDLTGLFPTNDYSLRISNFWNVTFDYVGVDITPQQPITVHRIDPTAYLYQAFQSPSLSSGNFTRYGNVTDLVTSEDNEFVIGRQGDAVSMQFDASSLPPPANGMVRDYFFYDSCWFKDENGNWGFGFGFTVDPLPFNTMSGFPYPQNESYPSDLEHTSYLTNWNTRIINPVTAEESIFSNLPLIILVTAATALLAVNLSYAITRLLKRRLRIQNQIMRQ
jgi:hypothetical protein